MLGEWLFADTYNRQQNVCTVLIGAIAVAYIALRIAVSVFFGK